MMRIRYRLWGLAVAASIGVHLALVVGINPPPSGTPEKPAGAPVSVTGSLASVLGGAVTSEPVEASAAEEVPPVQAAKAVAAKTAEAAQPSKAVEARPARVRATQAPPWQARSTQAVNIAPVQAAELVEAQTPTRPAAAAAEPVRAASAAAITPPEAREANEATGLTFTLPVKKPVERAAKPKAERPASDDRARPIPADRERRQASTRSRAGSERSGAAGATRGGRGGRSTASHGEIASYASQVRARILANRPSSLGSGRTVVSFSLSSSGTLRYARVARGSGNASLDSAALAAVRRSAPFPSPPPGAKPSQLRFSISFSFR